MTDVQNPLQNKHYQAINRSLATLNEGRMLIARAKAAGVDCSEQEANYDQLETDLENLKKEFFPARK